MAVLAACFEYLEELQGGKPSISRAVVAFLRQGARIAPEMQYFLSIYSFSEQTEFVVSDAYQSHKMNEASFRSQLVGQDAVFWIPQECAILSTIGRSARVAYLKHDTLPYAVFLLAFSRAGEGFELEDVHRLRLDQSPYHPFRHAHSARVLVLSLRRDLAPLGVRIEYDRSTQRYFLRSPVPILRLSVTSGGQRVLLARDRKSSAIPKLLEARLEKDRFIRTADICRDFKVTRQSMNRHLRALAAKGKVRLVKRGPISGYLWLDR
jgi:hypothetical protein